VSDEQQQTDLDAAVGFEIEASGTAGPGPGQTAADVPDQPGDEESE
jgi:hypothetical protein